MVSLTFIEESSFSRLSSIPIVITLEVRNPNTFAIKTTYLTYTVQAEGETLATGEKREFTEIPPEGVSIVDIPLTVSLDPIIRTVTRAAEKLEISLTAYGSVTVESFLGDIKIPFRKHFKKNLRSLVFPG